MERNQVTSLYNTLLEQNEGKATKQLKLTAIHKVCEALAQKGLPIEISNVVKHLAQSGTKIGKQSIYNKQSGTNPYRKLIDAWGIHSAHAKRKQHPPKAISQPENLVTDKDLADIKDPVIRYKVSMLYGEVTALRSQNNMLRDIRNLHAIQSVPTSEVALTQLQSSTLDEYETDLLAGFIASDGALSFNEDGRLYAKTSIPRGTSLSSDDLKSALQKVLRCHGKDSNE